MNLRVVVLFAAVASCSREKESPGAARPSVTAAKPPDITYEMPTKGDKNTAEFPTELKPALEALASALEREDHSRVATYLASPTGDAQAILTFWRNERANSPLSLVAAYKPGRLYGNGQGNPPSVHISQKGKGGFCFVSVKGSTLGDLECMSEEEQGY